MAGSNGGAGSFATANMSHVGGTGHNLHHDAPVEVAALVHAFFKGEPLPTIDR